MTSCHSGTPNLFLDSKEIAPPPQSILMAANPQHIPWLWHLCPSLDTPPQHCAVGGGLLVTPWYPAPGLCSAWRLVSHLLAEKWCSAAISVVNFLFCSRTLHSTLRFQSSPLVMPVRRFPSMQKLFFLHDSSPQGTSPCPKILCLFLCFYLLSYLVLRRLAGLEALGVLS